ncbi:translation initiation factor if-2-related [Holotrichia oblita]|nr:translation initiation factor if-2-related [Holotrichia oblita]
MNSITSEEAKTISDFFKNSGNKNTSKNKANDSNKQLYAEKSYKQTEGTSMHSQTTGNYNQKHETAQKASNSGREEATSKVEQKKETVNVKTDGTSSSPAQTARPQNSGRPQGDRPQGNRSQGDRPYNNRPQGDRPYNNRPQGDRPYNNRPQGDRPQGDRPYNNRPQGDRPQGDRPYNNRPQGDRPQGDRPYNNRPQSDRPQGDRPYNNRPQSDRPQGDRPYNNRPQGDRPQGDRPYNNRPQGDRPYNNRPYNNRPQGDRPQGDRPYNNRPQGDRPQGDRPYNNRPQGDRPQGDRPYNNRPQGDRPYRPQGSKPQGDRPYGNRPQGSYGRPQGTIDDKLRAFEKSKDKASAAQAVEKPAKDNVRRLNKAPVKTNKNNLSKKSEKPMEKPIFKKIVTLKPEPKPVDVEPKIIQIPLTITVKRFAEKMNIAGNEVIKNLVKRGTMITINEEIDFETASSLAEDYNFLVEEEIEVDLFEENFFEEPEKEEDLSERPPVVVVMGHVDHGKTSLLDSIRHSSVTTGEAGGITQHIGAYTVKAREKLITFIDTPGHEAFTAMRMRGAQVTDIAILVVAADDGVMPQTIEAINHAKAANVEIIVAINKIDKPSANPDRVKQELLEHGIVVEDFGGETISVPVSAIKKTGIDQLLEMIILTAEIKELKANPKKRARGTIIEALLDKGRGPVATVLVQSGTLNIGDPVVAGGAYGKVRAMTDDKGLNVKKAGPSIPVEILGLAEVPAAGDMFYVAESDKHARQVAEAYIAKGRVEMTKSSVQKVSLEDLFTQIKDGNIKELNIVVKADVQGSVEAIRQSLEKLSNNEVRVRIIHGGVGAINESDVMLASTSGAIVIGFNVRPEAGAKAVAEQQKIDIRLYRVIYSAIEDVQAAMTGMLDPVYEEKVVGHAEIRQLFKASGVGTIGGAYILDGKMIRNAKVRLTRDNTVIYEGVLDTLKRFKDDVKEVATGYECGLSFEKFNDLKEGDIVEAYMIVEVPR